MLYGCLLCVCNINSYCMFYVLLLELDKCGEGLWGFLMGRVARGIVMNFLYNLNSKIKSNCKSTTFYAHLQQRETNTSNKSFPFPLGLQLKASQACNFTASFMCFRSFGDLSALPRRQPTLPPPHSLPYSVWPLTI